MEKIIVHYKLSLKKLFLIDGIGALVSSFLLGIVLVRFEVFFGIPSSTLYFLAILPIFFALYDFYCFKKQSNDLGRFLNIIAIVNVLYCCLSIGFSFYHIEVIKVYGWLYIIIETLIVLPLSILELIVAKNN